MTNFVAETNGGHSPEDAGPRRAKRGKPTIYHFLNCKFNFKDLAKYFSLKPHYLGRYGQTDYVKN